MPNWKENKRFCKIYPIVLNSEGGYVYHPNDPGGATNHGIAYRFNDVAVRRYGIYKPEDMRRLTKEQALEIYYEKYWLPSKADELLDTGMAFVYFDFYVTSGGFADTLLDRLPDRRWPYLRGDGKNKAIWYKIIKDYLGLVKGYYTDLGKQARFKPFVKGWLNRVKNNQHKIDSNVFGNYNG